MKALFSDDPKLRPDIEECIKQLRLLLGCYQSKNVKALKTVFETYKVKDSEMFISMRAKFFKLPISYSFPVLKDFSSRGKLDETVLPTFSFTTKLCAYEY